MLTKPILVKLILDRPREGNDLGGRQVLMLGCLPEAGLGLIHTSPTDGQMLLYGVQFQFLLDHPQVVPFEIGVGRMRGHAEEQLPPTGCGQQDAGKTAADNGNIKALVSEQSVPAWSLRVRATIERPESHRTRPEALDQTTCALLDHSHGIQDYVLPKSAAYELNSCRQVFN